MIHRYDRSRFGTEREALWAFLLIRMVPLLLLACLPADRCRAQAAASTATSPVRQTVALTMPKALELAAQHNRHLQLASLAVKNAEEKRTLARSAYYPHIRNESSALYVTAVEGVVVPAGAFAHSAATGLIPDQTIKVGQGQQEAFTSGTGMIQPLTQLFTVHAGVRAAIADVNIAKLQAQESEKDVAVLVHKLYYDLLTKQLQLEATQASVQAAQLDEEENARAVRNGRVLEVVQLQSHSAFLSAKQAALTLDLAITDVTIQFDDVLGLPLGTPLTVDPDSLGENPDLPAQDAAIQTLREHNPKVLSARQAVEKARAAVAAAKDAYIPNISGLARYSYQSGVPFLVHNFGTIGGSVTYDLFDGGARESRLRAARFQLQAAQLELAQTEADVSVQVDSLYDEIHKLKELISVASDMLAVKQETQRISELRVQQNAALASEPARVRSEASVAKATLLEDRLNLRLVQIQVEQLLGQRPE